MEHVRRILLVTAGLSVAGAVLGALASVCALAVLVVGSAIVHRSSLLLDTELLVPAAAVGAMCGVVLGPVTAWIALRRVPLGRAMLTATAGTAIGALLGTPLPFGSLLGALAGFSLSAFWLRRTASREQLAPPAVSPNVRCS